MNTGNVGKCMKFINDNEWGYAVAYKKPSSGQLLWVFPWAHVQDVTEAQRLTDKWVNGKEGYQMYGHSKVQKEYEVSNCFGVRDGVACSWQDKKLDKRVYNNLVILKP